MSNYVEVENGIDPLNFNDNYFPKFNGGSTVPTNLADLHLSYSQGTHGDGRLVHGLRVPNNSKGYYQQRGLDDNDSDNYAIPDVLSRIEAVAKIWEQRHPDLTPLKLDVFTTGDPDYLNNLYKDDGRRNADGTPQVNGIRTGLNDLSRDKGGPFCWIESNGQEKCHDSHENGLDVDVRYVRNDNTEGGVKVSEPAYSQSLSQELINLFITEGGAIRVFVASGANIPSNNIIKYDPEHTDHFHVAFPNPNPPAGGISLQSTTPEVVVDSAGTIKMVSTVTTTAPIKDKYGLPLFEGFSVIVTADSGTQVLLVNDIAVNSSGNLSFQIERTAAGTAHISVETRNVYNQGQARGTLDIVFPAIEGGQP